MKIANWIGIAIFAVILLGYDPAFGRPETHADDLARTFFMGLACFGFIACLMCALPKRHS